MTQIDLISRQLWNPSVDNDRYHSLLKKRKRIYDIRLFSSFTFLLLAFFFLMRNDIDVIFFRTHSFQGCSIIFVFYSLTKKLLSSFKDNFILFLSCHWNLNPGSFVFSSSFFNHQQMFVRRNRTKQLSLTHLIWSKQGKWVKREKQRTRNFRHMMKEEKRRRRRENTRGLKWLHWRGVDVFFHRHLKTFQIPAKTNVFCYSFLLSFRHKRRIPFAFLLFLSHRYRFYQLVRILFFLSMKVLVFIYDDQWVEVFLLFLLLCHY